LAHRLARHRVFKNREHTQGTHASKSLLSSSPATKTRGLWRPQQIAGRVSALVKKATGLFTIFREVARRIIRRFLVTGKVAIHQAGLYLLSDGWTNPWAISLGIGTSNVLSSTSLVRVLRLDAVSSPLGRSGPQGHEPTGPSNFLGRFIPSRHPGGESRIRMENALDRESAIPAESDAAKELAVNVFSLLFDPGLR